MAYTSVTSYFTNNDTGSNKQHEIPLKDGVEVKGWALRWPDVSDSTIINSEKEYDGTSQLIKENLKNASSLLESSVQYGVKCH